MKSRKSVFLAVFLTGVVAMMLLAVSCFGSSSQEGVITELENKTATLQEENQTLGDRVAALEFENAELIKRGDELKGEKDDLKAKLSAETLKTASLEERIQNLEKEAEALRQPPVSADASTPWERVQAAVSFLKAGDFENYWTMLNSEFKEKCPQGRFVELLKKVIDPSLVLDPKFIEEAVGRTRAYVTLSFNGNISTQELRFENGEWMIYVGTRGC